MKKNYMITAILLVTAITAFPQKKGTTEITLLREDAKETISRHIYGHFSEHLGNCIYGGYWVGPDSPIPNTNGIRNDVVSALREINIPNLRWPGGCFADEYHWMDGIGPRDQRPEMINTHWGGVTEDNSFGTHEFMELCNQLGTEPVICGNVGSGTVKEMSQWVEYLNFDGVSPMADLRRVNGQDEPWGVKFWGVGNENWGCGGNMTPEFYSDQYRRYATYCRNYGDNWLFKIACGANASDYRWTETLMKNIPHHMMQGLSLHHYTVDWSDRGSATEFGDSLYVEVLRRCLQIEDVIDKHIAIMDKYDPEKRVALIFDEWGTWYEVEPGTNPGFLFQQNTMRDALVAALTLNYLNDRCDRIKMANIAQTINVLQALIFTDGNQMVLTPTYHVYDMYKVHQDATMIPVKFKSPVYRYGERELEAVSVSASEDKDGKIHVSVVNIDHENAQPIAINTGDLPETATVSCRILQAEAYNSYNTFGADNVVVPDTFSKVKIKDGEIQLKIPASSVIMLEISRKV